MESRRPIAPDLEGAPLGPPLELDVRPMHPEGALVAMAGELCLATSGEADVRLRRVLAEGTPRLVLDLRRLHFLDSTGIRLLLALDARAQAEGFGFSVLLDDGAPSRALELVGMKERPQRADAAEVEGALAGSV